MTENLALTGATLIDGTGAAPLPDALILVEGEAIVAAGSRNRISLPESFRVIDCGNAYIMPGMLDANVHLFFNFTAGGLIRSDDRYDETVAQAARLALRNGLTTVFDTWGPRAALTRVRHEIERGERIGSRIFFAGNIIGLGGPTSNDFHPAFRSVLTKKEAAAIDACWEQGVGPDLLWMTPDEVRRSVRHYVEGGQQDFLKYAASGHSAVLEYHGHQFLYFSAETQRAIVEEGRRAGMTVQAHTTSPESLRMAVEAGVDILQHGDVTGPVPMPEETLSRIVERKIPCAALFVTRRYLKWVDAHMPNDLKKRERVKDENDRRLVAAGATLLLTTDSGVLPKENPDQLLEGLGSADDAAFSLGEAHFHWLEAASELGMKPMDALLAATLNPARAYGKEAMIGTLEPGKKADLLVLDANPLENPKNYRRITRVMKDGVFVGRGG